MFAEFIHVELFTLVCFVHDSRGARVEAVACWLSVAGGCSNSYLPKTFGKYQTAVRYTEAASTMSQSVNRGVDKYVRSVLC